MTSILASQPPARLPATGDSFGALLKPPSDCRILSFASETHIRIRTVSAPRWRHTHTGGSCVAFSGKLEDSAQGDDESEGEDSPETGIDPVNSDKLREKLERIVGADDSRFSGIDLATLIRKKYGRSYDVQLIKKEFMGKNLLALNVMWKYMEQVN